MTSEEIFEAERAARIERTQAYKQMMINDILDFQTRNQFTREMLEKMTIRSLERIYDNVN